MPVGPVLWRFVAEYPGWAKTLITLESRGPQPPVQLDGEDRVRELRLLVGAPRGLYFSSTLEVVERDVAALVLDAARR